LRLRGPIDETIQQASGQLLPCVLVVERSVAASKRMLQRLQGRFRVRHVADIETGWQVTMVDPSVRGIAIGDAASETEAAAFVGRVRASRLPRVARLPIVRLRSADDDVEAALVSLFGALPGAPPRRDGPAEDEALAPPLAGFLTQLKTRIDTLVGKARSAVQIIPNPFEDPVDEFPSPVTLDPSAQPAPEALPAKAAPVPAPVPVPIPVPVAVAAAVPPRPAVSPSPIPQEPPMSRFESLNKILKNLQSESPGVEASALISEDGLMIASALSQDLDETRVAGMTATLLNLGTRAATELRRGAVSEVIVRGEQGYAVMIGAGRGALMLVLASANTPLGLIFFDMREAIKAVRNVL